MGIQPRKSCKRCGGPKGPGKGRDYCDTCGVGVRADAGAHRAYQRAWQAHNRERVQTRRLVKYERAKARLREFKATGCADCGEDDLRVLRIHHTGEKTLRSSDFLTCGDEKREAELSLCIVLCANCHLRRHADADTFADAGRRAHLRIVGGP